MRVGIDGRYIQDHFPGIGRYTYNLVKALGEQERGDTLIVLHDSAQVNTRYDIAKLTALGVELWETDVPTFSLKQQWAMPAIVRHLRLDVFHSPYYVAPLRLPCPSVVTIHDAIPSRYPTYLPSPSARIAYRLFMRLSMLCSTLVIADSDASRAELSLLYPRSTSKIRVVPLAADDFATTACATRNFAAELGQYILYVGINKPHKNLERLIQAFAATALAHKLVISGQDDPRFPQARNITEALGLGERVVFLGPVSEGDLSSLYRGAELFVFPSLAEGFGLPVLEAMASGLPVVCSNIPPLAEIVGDAAVVVDPLDMGALSQAMELVLTDEALRAQLRIKAKERARRFSWRRTAQESLAVYQESIDHLP